MCFISGYLIDAVWGRRKASLIFASIVALGSAFVAYGAYTNSLLVIYVGRFIFGIGSESMALCEYAYNIHWFDRQKLGNEPEYKPIIGLSLMFGVAISISRGATAAAFQIIGRAYAAFAGIDYERTIAIEENHLTLVNETILYYNGPLENAEDVKFVYKASNEAAGKTLGICVFYAVICGLLCGLLGWVDIQGNRWRKQRKVSAESANMGEATEMNLLSKEQEANMPQSTAVTPAANPTQAVEEDDDDQPKMVSFNDIMSIPLSGWLIFVICVCFYATIFPFVSQAVEFFKLNNGVESDGDARTYASLVLVLSGMGIAPLFGILIDTYKYNAVWLGSGISFAFLAHFGLRFVVIYSKIRFDTFLGSQNRCFH